MVVPCSEEEGECWNRSGPILPWYKTVKQSIDNSYSIDMIKHRLDKLEDLYYRVGELEHQLEHCVKSDPEYEEYLRLKKKFGD